MLILTIWYWCSKQWHSLKVQWILWSCFFARAHTIEKNGNSYRFILYALNFEKDQVLHWNPIGKGPGHRHDWEWAAIWLRNGAVFKTL